MVWFEQIPWCHAGGLLFAPASIPQRVCVCMKWLKNTWTDFHITWWKYPVGVWVVPKQSLSRCGVVRLPQTIIQIVQAILTTSDCPEKDYGPHGNPWKFHPGNNPVYLEMILCRSSGLPFHRTSLVAHRPAQTKQPPVETSLPPIYNIRI